MDVPNTVVDMIRNIYAKNLKILNSQSSNELAINNNLEKLFQNYWISNERLKNVLETIDTLNPGNKD